MRRRVLTYLALTAGLAIVLGVGVAAFRSLQVPLESTSPSPTPQPVACAPAPCADVRGFTLWVSDLKSEGNLVSIQAMFRNSSQATHADPSDLALIDSTGQANHLDFSLPDCTQWSRHEFSGGETYGPLTLCFRVASTSPPLVLRWAPDFGLFCCQTEIKLG